MDDDGPGGSWVDHDDLIWAAGLAALLLVALLVWAVLRTSTDASERGPSSPGIATSTSAGTSSTVRTGWSTTSYPLPRPQASEPAVAPPPPTVPPETAAPQPDSPIPTTIYNPYAPTTTVPSAGSI